MAPNPLLITFLRGEQWVASFKIDLINLGASFGFSFLHIAWSEELVCYSSSTSAITTYVRWGIFYFIEHHESLGQQKTRHLVGSHQDVYPSGVRFIRTRARIHIEMRQKGKIVNGRKGRTRKKGICADLGVESSEPCSIPWVWLQAIARSIVKTICSSSENFIYNEGTLPFGLELVLFLFR